MLQKLKTMLKMIILVLIFLACLHGNATEKTQLSCPVGPASSTREPTKMLGKPGKKGDPGDGKFIKEKHVFIIKYLTKTYIA